MSWIKICGLTNLDDALLAIEVGADALGFILDPTSPRFVPHHKLEKLLPQLPRQVKTVAVFGRYIRSAVVDLFDSVQSFDVPKEFPGSSIETRRARPGLTEQELSAPLKFGQMVVLDAYSPEANGGTGDRIDLELAGRVIVASPHRVILAGGLNPDNVGPTIESCQPWGVDVSSGVEVSPGIKDHAKVRAFVLAARRAY